MSNKFNVYAVRSGDLWWSQYYRTFMSSLDHSSFTPTYDGSAQHRIGLNIKRMEKEVQSMKDLYPVEYVPPNDYLCYSRANIDAQIAYMQAELDVWKNAKVVEVELTAAY